MTTARPQATDTTEQLPPWLAKLPPECRDAIRRNVAQAPPLTDDQVQRVAALLRTGGGAR